MMHDLQNIILAIVADDNSHSLLAENNGHDISKILNARKLSYSFVKISNYDVQGDLLILFLKDNTLIDSYDYIGRMTHNFQERFIIIRKLDTQDYITDTHNMLMSLGFKMIFKSNENKSL